MNDGGVVILSRRVIRKSGCFAQVRFYLRGSHPHRGILTNGFTGPETIEEKDVIIPIKTFQVVA